MSLYLKAIMVWLLAGTVSWCNFAHGSELRRIDIPQAILDAVSVSLPERAEVDAEFLDPAYDPNLYLSKDAKVAVTFVHEGAGYHNSLGYYTYDPDTFASLRKSFRTSGRY